MNQRLNQRLRDLIQQLGEAIHESVVESDEIAGVVQNIRRQGFDVMLVLEATIGLNDVTKSEDDEETSSQELAMAGDEGPFTSHDLSFLKSLRISIEGDD
jgi:uncharacterized protein (UPF0335 family)